MTEERGSRVVRIVADDLSGALDAAAPFAARLGGFGVWWRPHRPVGDDSAAIDTGTRECDEAAAVAHAREAARAQWADPRVLAFKKVDSVWRGHAAAEIAAVANEIPFERIVVAPAFPEQGRVTRDGGQWVAEREGWRCVAPDIAGELRRTGLDASTEAAATGRTSAIVCDAGSAHDLAAIVARWSDRGARTLWCGTAGLARALAAAPSLHIGTAGVPRAVEGPVLVVVGTDHPASVAQAEALAQQPGVGLLAFDAARSGGASVSNPDASVLLVRFAFAPGTPPVTARTSIAETLRTSASRLPRPALAVVTGGETVRALSEALGATRLAVLGEREPGIAIAQWTDGAWAGTRLFTKSGGFGLPDTLIRLVANAASDLSSSRTLS